MNSRERLAHLLFPVIGTACIIPIKERYSLPEYTIRIHVDDEPGIMKILIFPIWRISTMKNMISAVAYVLASCTIAIGFVSISPPVTAHTYSLNPKMCISIRRMDTNRQRMRYRYLSRLRRYSTPKQSGMVILDFCMLNTYHTSDYLRIRIRSSSMIYQARERLK